MPLHSSIFFVMVPSFCIRCLSIMVRTGIYIHVEVTSFHNENDTCQNEIVTLNNCKKKILKIELKMIQLTMLLYIYIYINKEYIPTIAPFNYVKKE